MRKFRCTLYYLYAKLCMLRARDDMEGIYAYELHAIR